MPSRPSESSVPLAWRVEINDISCIVFAATKAKARWVAVRAYWEAGYGRGTWPNPVAVRAPRHDNSPRRNEWPQAWNEEFV